jgi:Dinitrogenase iron-molybdenum cofactor
MIYLALSCGRDTLGTMQDSAEMARDANVKEAAWEVGRPGNLSGACQAGLAGGAARSRSNGRLSSSAGAPQPLVAVVTRDGLIAPLTPNVPAWVLVFSTAEGRLHLVEKRRIEVRPTDFSRPGWQIERLRVILHGVRGCKTLVLSRITMPQRLLIEARGIRVLEASGFVEEALTEVAALDAAVSQPAIQAWPQYRR